jgi:hypothetical protein
MGDIMGHVVRQSLAAFGLLLLAASLSACVIVPGRPGGGWCYWHPGACR